MRISKRSAYLCIQIFKKINEQYPNSRFILNTRNRDNWIQSRLNLNQNIDNRITYRSCTCGDNVHGTKEELIQCWKEEWNRHHNKVLSYLEDKPDKLLYFNITKDPIDKLVHFFSDWTWRSNIGRKEILHLPNFRYYYY
ncbi:MAG: sulfotransferase [Gracilimonas sp.]|nr:sulfotransferase [Gracilimonas sp.]